MDFINSIKDGAIKAMKEYGICASLTIAQAILESGWGQNAPGNNLFGIKWTEGCGYESQDLATQECYNGVWQNIVAPFRKYDSLADSVYDHAMFLVQNSNYANLLGVTDYKQACKLIQEDGYATAPDYADSLIEIIEENKLYEYDNQESDDEVKTTKLKATATLPIYKLTGMSDGKIQTEQVSTYSEGQTFEAIRGFEGQDEQSNPCNYWIVPYSNITVIVPAANTANV